MTRNDGCRWSRRLIAGIASLWAVPSFLGAQSSNRSPNPAYAAIAGPVGRILSGDRAFATTNYVQQFYRDPAGRGFDAAIDSVI